jgi:hypothetical protein
MHALSGEFRCFRYVSDGRPDVDRPDDLRAEPLVAVLYGFVALHPGGSDTSYGFRLGGEFLGCCHPVSKHD